MSGDLRSIVEGVLLVFAALLPIVNPFGGAPVFLAMTADCTPEVRATLAKRIAVNAFLLLLGSVSIGAYVLDFFGLSVPIVQVAGGIVVCAAGWEMLHADTVAKSPPAAPPAAAEIARRAFYPLTLPLTVGPGTISVAITIGANHPHSMPSLLFSAVADVVGAALIAASVYVCYGYADRMLQILGATGTSVVVRLSAFILMCIGVQIIWNGVSALLGVPLLQAR
jgi:multiple antibiotic resistance protein